MGILAVVLGLLAALCALFATFLLGTVGGIIAGVLAAAAIVVGIVKRKKEGKGGIPAMVIGTLALMMAISLTNVWSAAFQLMHEKALEYKPDGMWAQISEEYNSGALGILKRLPQDEASINALVEEMNELNQIVAN